MSVDNSVKTEVIENPRERNDVILIVELGASSPEGKGRKLNFFFNQNFLKMCRTNPTMKDDYEAMLQEAVKVFRESVAQ